MEITYTLDNLQQIADKILTNAQNKYFLFYGDMGVGKTTLIKALAKQLGVTDNISSPTFSLVNEYESTDGVIYHFDFYRIEDETEALDMGIEEYFYSDNWVFIEWPEKINKLLPDEHTSITLSKNKNGSRTLNILPVK
ncbi:MAG: tRNA (adenosine(37)-N6)-threonylcarbamoyltransferase complex ATPase subunit type 1 TsaE [Flavobacteriaceae bacterium]|jgi:tRNA threonylcarbamoyladenosine biosynthesis protein TsaE|nr:tRNA (adenosine(37)-N6)-threonylcarbamoyltransferase complex ATPase subunit type 1 TsaE [Flavobacteriaceae bacterium]HBY67338.1 tRNA (adenosine(37)-N6)-threonylcarbamoyltransferase complex ATPase subunit type 1 TsaE [Flavobacteriaceae bacterium]|tara:strand:+ start:1415 stop:1828 length:414 start_codon:yes stop_codon:yes gene_type:complete